MNANKIEEAYAVLGLRPGASQQEISQAWNELTLLWDPSIHSTGTKAYEQCVRMRETTNAAYELLTGAVKAEPVAAVAQQAAPPVPAPASAVDSGDSIDSQYCAAKAMETSDLAAAIESYKRLAQIGHAKSQFRLGHVYFEGPAKDVAQSAYWWKRAADQGHIIAQFNLGLMYERGVGMPKDPRQAYYWFCEAAKRGDSQAKAKIRAFDHANAATNVSQQANPKPAISASEAQALLPWAQPVAGATNNSLDSKTARDYVARKHQAS